MLVVFVVGKFISQIKDNAGNKFLDYPKTNQPPNF